MQASPPRDFLFVPAELIPDMGRADKVLKYSVTRTSHRIVLMCGAKATCMTVCQLQATYASNAVFLFVKHGKVTSGRVGYSVVGRYMFIVVMSQPLIGPLV